MSRRPSERLQVTEALDAVENEIAVLEALRGGLLIDHDPTELQHAEQEHLAAALRYSDLLEQQTALRAELSGDAVGADPSDPRGQDEG